MGSYNKIVINGVTKLDLTNDTIKPSAMLSGYSAHGSNGVIINGTLFEDRPDEEILIEELADSNGIDILDNSSNSITVGMEYVNKIKHYKELKRLNDIIDELSNLIG